MAALDATTCLVCANLDNNIYDRLSGGPTPPYNQQNYTTAPEQPIHPHCRCIMVPVLVGDREATLAGPSYHDWFERQSAAVQLDILGPSRYKEFRDGHITINAFTNDRNQIKTLNDLGIDRITRNDLLEFAPKMDFTLETIPRTIEDWLKYEAEHYNVEKESTLKTHFSLWKAELKRLGLSTDVGKAPPLEDLLAISGTTPAPVVIKSPVPATASPKINAPNC